MENGYKVVASAGDTEMIAVSDAKVQGKRLMSHSRNVLNRRAQLAQRLVEQSGMMVGVAGEDGMVMRLLDPEDVVRRAVAIASLLFNEMERREWIADVPDFLDAIDIDNQAFN